MGGKSRKGREEEKLQRRKEEEAGEEEEKKNKKRHQLTVKNTEKSLYIYTGIERFLFSFCFILKFLSYIVKLGASLYFFFLNLGPFFAVNFFNFLGAIA